MATSIAYHARILGRLWMPQCLAATSRHYSRDTYPFTAMTPAPYWNDKAAELENIEDRLMMDAGDFSSVEDYEITRVCTVVRPDPAGGVIRQTNETTIRPWADPDNEFAYFDCMHGDA